MSILSSLPSIRRSCYLTTTYLASEQLAARLSASHIQRQSRHIYTYNYVLAWINSLHKRRIGAAISDSSSRSYTYKASQGLHSKIGNAQQANESNMRLENEIRLSSQSGSPKQREVVWGLFKWIIDSDDVHYISRDTIFKVIDIISNDTQTTRVLGRIADSVSTIAAKSKKLTGQDIELIYKNCITIEHGYTNPFAKALPEILKAEVVPDQIIHQNKIGDLSPDLRVNSIQPANCNAFDTDPGVADIERLREMVSQSYIMVDTNKMWDIYKAIISNTPNEQNSKTSDPITDSDVAKVVKCCSLAGTITGKRLIAEIENDIAAGRIPSISSWPETLAAMINGYARLGLIHESKRCYNSAAVQDSVDSAQLDWAMCKALFISSRHKEGQRLFDAIVDKGEATSKMYTQLISEYARVLNTQRALALFDDMRNRNIKPEYKAFCTLATICATNQNPKLMSLSSLTAYMKSWGYVPDSDFIAGILKGYSRSVQIDMFNGLVMRISSNWSYQDSDAIDSVILGHATMTKDANKVASMLAGSKQIGPERLPAAVHTLCYVGRAEAALELVDQASELPQTNLLENVKLELQLQKPEMAEDPGALITYVREMIKQGFTPSFKLASDVLSHIWLYGGRKMAICMYDEMRSSGVPCSVGFLFIALQIHLDCKDPELALGIFSELYDSLSASDFGSLKLPHHAIRKLMLMLIGHRGIDHAQDVFDMLSSLPIRKALLPYAVMIDYYLNHGMPGKARSLITYSVQHNIVLSQETVNLYATHLSKDSTLTDFANFLRYLARTGMLSKINYQVISVFFVQCILEHRMADFEWMVGIISSWNQKTAGPLWRMIVKAISPFGLPPIRVLAKRFVSSLKHEEINKPCILLITSLSGMQWGAAVADSILISVKAHKLFASRALFKVVIRSITYTWKEYYGSGPRKACSLSLPYLNEALERHIYHAAKSKIDNAQIVDAMVQLSSLANGYKRCLAALSHLPDEAQDIRLYGAIIKGCSKYGTVNGINEVLDNVKRYNLKLTDRFLNSVMNCFININPPKSTNSDEDYQRDVIAQFYRSCLDKVLSLVDEFNNQGLSMSQSSYSILMQACINAGYRDMVESFVEEMVEKGIEHNGVTALVWMRARLLSSNLRGALAVFRAIGDKEKCAQMCKESKKYTGLDGVEKTQAHYSLLVKYFMAKGTYSKAFEYLESMHKQGLKSDLQLYKLLLKFLAKNERKTEFVAVMKAMANTNVIPDEQMMVTIRGFLGRRET